MNKIVIIAAVFLLVIAIIWGAYFFITGNKKPAPALDQAQNQQPANNFMIQGMQVTIQTQGTGTQTKTGDAVTVNYVGTLADGKVFDSSISRNAPFTFKLGQGRVIKGWDLGVVGMKVGEKRKLVIPPQLAYGANGFPPVIPANATLTFEVTLLKIN